MTVTCFRFLPIAVFALCAIARAQPKAPAPVLTADEARVLSERALRFIPEMAASFDGGVITGESIRQLMRPQLQAQTRMGVQLPKARLVQWALALTESELDHQLLVRQSMAAGYKPDLFTARQQLAERRRQMGEDAYAQTMAMQGVDEDVVVRKMAENEMVNRWLAEQVAPTVEVDEDEARRYYKDHKDEFEMPAARRLWHILVAKRLNVPKQRQKFFRQNAEDMLVRLREGMPFERLAKSGSDCPSATNGGDLGLVSDDKLNKNVRSAVKRLKFGQISDVLESPAGVPHFHGRSDRTGTPAEVRGGQGTDRPAAAGRERRRDDEADEGDGSRRQQRPDPHPSGRQMTRSSQDYWDAIADEYQRVIRIRVDGFHYGPLVPGDSELGLLPEDVRGLRCLELGSGGAQNSVYLAGRGARCVACDISGGQLLEAGRLAQEHHVFVDLVQADLDHLPFRAKPTFDLIHSCYALPFVDEPCKVIQVAAEMLAPGGAFILSTSHPLAMGEWLEVDEGETGVFMQDYFRPATDWRQEGDAEEVCRAVPLSTLFQWFVDAGLTVERLLEPVPPSRAALSDRALRERVPYWSKDWAERRDELSRVPFLTVVRAVRR